jgi:signal peptidase II
MFAPELIRYVCNKNIAWSIPIAPGFFYLVWVVIFLILVYCLAKSKTEIEKISLTVILSGAASNLFDRLTHGCVSDFIDLKFWPVFNLADICITIGIIMLAYSMIKNNPRKEASKF